MDYRETFFKKYVSGHANRIYGSQTIDEIERQFPIWRRYFGSFLPASKSASILDLGTGNGGLVHWLRSSGYENVRGIDVSPEQVEAASELGIEGIEEGDIMEFLSGKKGSYDRIFARDVFEHFSKEEAFGAAEAAFASLKPNGCLVIQTVNAENFLWGRLRYGDFTHEQAFTKESASQLFSVAGFREVKVYPQRPVVHGIVSAIRLFLWMAFEALMRFYLLIEIGSAKGIFTQNLIVCARKQ